MLIAGKAVKRGKLKRLGLFSPRLGITGWFGLFFIDTGLGISIPGSLDLEPAASLLEFL